MVARLSRLIADAVFSPDSVPITTSEGMPRMVVVIGAKVTLEVADHFLSGQDEDRPAMIGGRETELPDFAPVYFGHRWAFSTGANSAGATG